MFPSDAAERGRGATFDNALFESVGSRREPAPSAAAGVSAHSAYPRVQESAMVSGLFSLASRSRDKPARKGVLFLF